MTVKYLNGNAFEGKGDVVVVTTNCVGAMGRGIALECKLRHPWLYSTYYRFCRKGVYRPGVIFEKFCLFDSPKLLENGNHKNILLFPTKGDWKKPSRIEWIETGLKDLARIAKEKQWGVVDMTLPGCANGWIKDVGKVTKLVKLYLEKSDTQFCIYSL